MKPYQKPPIEAAVLPATEMIGRPQRPPVPGSRGPPPHYKSRPGSGLFASGAAASAAIQPLHHGPGQHHPHLLHQQHHPGGSYPVPAPRSAGSSVPASAVVSSAVPGNSIGSKLAKPMARYHPSLSGSETDVSTSTENLTQVSFYNHYYFVTFYN